jgi:hypothetical protein
MKSYSHPATKQDLWVLERRAIPGTFIELGAYDGERHSNTKLLEQKGWHGILVEGHQPFAALCQKNRPNTKVVNKFIGDGWKHKVAVGGQYTGLLDKMPPEFAFEHERRENETYMADTVPLAEAVGIDPVNYLSLDTEGSEDEILAAWFKAGGKCELLTVEYRYDKALLNRLCWICGDSQMELVEMRGFDACFVNRAWYD